LSFIPLDRRFLEWDKEDAPDPDIRIRFELEDGGIGWEDLTKKHRVVILVVNPLF